jgi:hypothetical protein
MANSPDNEPLCSYKFGRQVSSLARDPILALLAQGRGTTVLSSWLAAMSACSVLSEELPNKGKSEIHMQREEKSRESGYQL